VAQRGRDVLEQKRRTLLHQLAELDELLAVAQGQWAERAREAELWWKRAAILAGERPLELASASVRGEAEVKLVWRNALGVVYPSDATVSVPVVEDFPAGGSSALAFAADAHRRALDAAAMLGATMFAHERTASELRATARRLRAIERRLIPEHERALQALELSLDENDREDAARARWVTRHQAARAS
jgi:V/A-type H+-transporting ATPase subunit D